MGLCGPNVSMDILVQDQISTVKCQRPFGMDQMSLWMKCPAKIINIKTIRKTVKNIMLILYILECVGYL